MEEVCRELYAELYTAREEDQSHAEVISSAFSGIYTKLTKDMRQSLRQEVTVAELSHALTAMARGKAPGPDGLLVEFYQCMWPCMCDDYHRMIQRAMEHGSFPSCVTDVLIALLHKGGNWQSLNNWRPITLLNVAYKIFAKALQIRVQPILMEIISSDQSAFLPMRYILDNIFLTHETIDFAKCSRQPLLFLKLDFSKA